MYLKPNSPYVIVDGVNQIAFGDRTWGNIVNLTPTWDDKLHFMHGPLLGFKDRARNGTVIFVYPCDISISL